MRSSIRSRASFLDRMEGRPRAMRFATAPLAGLLSRIRIWPGPWITAMLFWNHTGQSVNYWTECSLSERMGPHHMLTLHSNRKFSLTFVLVLLVLILPCRISAQVDTGAISGTVKDTSGGFVAGAKVTLTNEGTGLSIS